MSDFVTSWLRTVVPGLWSALVTALLAWAVTSAPWLLDVFEALHIDLESPATVVFVMGLVLAIWYALWRRIEPHVPDWLSRLAMGSAKMPLYAANYPEAKYATDDRVLLNDGSLVTIGATIMEPGANVASYTVTYPSGQQAEVRESDILGKR